jgi:hypothetical protein
VQTCITTRPDPVSAQGRIRVGVAVHNGIWLCEICAAVIDKAPEAYPVETLRAWKSYAETLAARESRTTEDILRELIGDLARLHTAISDFATHWQRAEPMHSFEDFEGSTQRLTLPFSTLRLCASEIANKYGARRAVFRDGLAARAHYRDRQMPPTSGATDNHGNSTSERRRYRDLREREERQRLRREEFIERLVEQERERRLHSFQRPSAADTESIEGPAPTEDSSVPPDPPPRV